MALTFFDKYLRTVKDLNVNLTKKSQDLLTLINRYLSALSVPPEAISIVNDDQEKFILLPSFNLKLVCKNRLVFSQDEPLQEVSLVVSGDPEIEVIKFFFTIAGTMYINKVPSRDEVDIDLDDQFQMKMILNHILQGLYDLGIIKAEDFSKNL